jgi:hypothetical protein
MFLNLNDAESLDGLTAMVKVAEVIEREIDFVIHDWMEMVEKQDDLMHILLKAVS